MENRRCPSVYGKGSSRTLSITLKIAVVEPIPKPSARTAERNSPRSLWTVRRPKRTSCHRDVIHIDNETGADWFRRRFYFDGKNLACAAAFGHRDNLVRGNAR